MRERKSRMRNYSVVDLFAGAGGLSLGFLQTKRFNIVAAAEKNPNAQLTYKQNYPTVELVDDVKKIDSKLSDKFGKIDVVIGGPPCQGFSNANRQKAQTISTNNALVKEYVRAICELKPTVFVMENVGMLRSEVHRFYYSEKDRAIIGKLDINLRKDELELLAERYCEDQQEALKQTLTAYSEYLWTDKEYLAVNVLYRQRNNYAKLKKAIEKYHHRLELFVKRLTERGDGDSVVTHAEYEMAKTINAYLNASADGSQVTHAIELPIMLQRMYKHYQELVCNQIIIDGISLEKGICAKISSFPVFEYVQKVLSAEPYCYDIKPGVLNAVDFGVPQKRERYIVIGAKNGHKAVLPKGNFVEGEYRTVRDAIEDIEGVPTYFNVTTPPRLLEPIETEPGSLLSVLRDSDRLYNHIITETEDTAMERFKALKQGQNFHCLDDSLKTTYTDAKRTQNTIYLRLNYSEPSGTVVNVRKSMWVHPKLDRALSVREAARLQSFPDSFIFKGTKDAQYQQVGNAVPPILAKAIAEQVLMILEEDDNNG